MSTDTRTIELMVSPTKSTPSKDNFALLRGGKPDNTKFTTKQTNIFIIDSTVIPDHD